MKIGRGVRKGCCLSLILFNLYGEYLTKEAQNRRTSNLHCEYADDMLLAKEEMELLSMTERLIEIRRCYGMEMNVEKLR